MKFNQEVYQFLYKRDKPVPMKIMGLIAAIFSIGGLATAPVFGIIMAIAAGGVFMYQSGIEVNFNALSYREITAFGSHGFGEWKPLPDLKCVSVFKTNLVSRTYGRSNASFTNRNTIFQVNLATSNNRRIRLFDTENSDEAFRFAQDIAKQLNLNIWDATSQTGKWL